MNRNTILLTFTILLINSVFIWTYGQTSTTEGLLKEKIQQSRSFGEEWGNDRKNSYQYDIFGNEILNRTSVWDQESFSWAIVNEELSEFDGERHRTWFHLIDYQQYPEKLRDRKEKREYENGLVKYRNITIQDYNVSFTDSLRVYDVFYEYNENGDRTEFRVHYNANNEFRGGYGFRWHFNENYCETAFVDYNIDSGGKEIISDSTATSRDSWCNITQESKFDFSFGYYDQFSDKRFDYEYDPMGNILSLTEFQRTKSYEDWEKVVTKNYIFNDSVKLISFNEFNFLSMIETQQTFVYDFQGRLIHSSEEMKESPEADWIIDSDFNWYFNDLDLLEKEELNSDWNPIGDVFNSISLTEYVYDSEGNNVHILFDRTLNGQRTTKEELREFRCDGRTLLETIINRTYINSSIVRTEDKFESSYFKKAPCQFEDPASASFIIYPNPADSYFRIFNEESFGDSHLRLINSKGELIKELNAMLDNYFALDLSALEPGLYIIQIENDAGKFSQKFVKK